MTIQFNEETKIFKLDTKETTYLIGVSPEGYVGHIYYGERMEAEDAYYLLRTEEPPYTPGVNAREKSSFLDFFPMEYPSGGVGDYRESCINIRNEAGCMGSEFLYESYTIRDGKPRLEGLPASFGAEDEVQTLEITCTDPVLQVKIVLAYSVFEKEDVITRSVKIINEGKRHLKLEKVYSACLDMDDESFDMMGERTPHPKEENRIWETACFVCKGRVRTSGTSVSCTCNTGYDTGTGESLCDAFCVFGKFHRPGREDPI